VWFDDDKSPVAAGIPLRMPQDVLFALTDARTRQLVRDLGQEGLYRLRPVRPDWGEALVEIADVAGGASTCRVEEVLAQALRDRWPGDGQEPISAGVVAALVAGATGASWVTCDSDERAREERDTQQRLEALLSEARRLHGDRVTWVRHRRPDTKYFSFRAATEWSETGYQDSLAAMRRIVPVPVRLWTLDVTADCPYCGCTVPEGSYVWRTDDGLWVCDCAVVEQGSETVVLTPGPSPGAGC
jgi:hypothetical protein